MRFSFVSLAILMMATPAFADNIADCEILLMELIPDEMGEGHAQVASYRPAGDYISSVYNDDIEVVTHVGTLPIRALMCQRNDVVPVEEDYALLATGIPFILSQDFDSSDTDSMTLYWKEGRFQYLYEGHPLTSEAEENLKARLGGFSGRDHGLAKDEEAEDAAPETHDEVEDEVINDIKDNAEDDIADKPADDTQKHLTPAEQKKFE